MEKVSGNWQHCQKTWLRLPLQNNGWIRALVEQKIHEDDETVAVQLHVHAMLKEQGYNTSLHTILRCWTLLGWTFRGSKYRQLICALKWAWPYITESFEPSEVSATSHGLTSLPCNWKAINSALKSSVPTVEAQSSSIFFTPRGVCRKYGSSILRSTVNCVRSTNVSLEYL